MENTPLTRKDIDPIIKAIGRIEHALLGDEGMEIEGIAAKVARHDKHIDNSVKRLGWFTGLSAALGYFIHQIIEFFTHKN